MILSIGAADVTMVTFGTITVTFKHGGVTVQMHGDDDEVLITGDTGTVKAVSGSDVALMQNGGGYTAVNGDGPTQIAGDGVTTINGSGENHINGAGKTKVGGGGHTLVESLQGTPLIAFIPGEPDPTIRVWPTCDPDPHRMPTFDQCGHKMSARMVGVQVSSSPGNPVKVIGGGATVSLDGATVNVTTANAVDVLGANDVFVRDSSAEVRLPAPNGQGGDLKTIEEIVADSLAAAPRAAPAATPGGAAEDGGINPSLND